VALIYNEFGKTGLSGQHCVAGDSAADAFSMLILLRGSAAAANGHYHPADR